MRQGVFQAPEVGLLFEAVCLGPPYEKSQKMGDLGVLADANTSILVRWRRMEKERDIGLQQIAVYRNKFTLFVFGCIILF